MSKISKIYPAFYGGISEQADELILDTQCKDMDNCVPDVVLGAQRRNGTEYISDTTGITFHTYDRGEGIEQYKFIKTDDALNPLAIEDKNGTIKTITYKGDKTELSEYIEGTNLVGLTVQDRTFILNKDKVVGATTRALEDTAVTNYSYPVSVDQVLVNLVEIGTTDVQGIPTVEYGFTGTITVSLTVGATTVLKTSNTMTLTQTGTTVSDATSIAKELLSEAKASIAGVTLKGATEDVLVPTTTNISVEITATPTVGSLKLALTTVGTYTIVIIDEANTNVGYYWLNRSSNDSNNTYNYAVYLNGVTYQFASDNTDDGAIGLAGLINASTDFIAVAIGSIIRITSTLDTWTLDSWDSWGNQASKSWKGEIGKLTDLPPDMPWDDVTVNITGNDNDTFTDYFVNSDGGVWKESRDLADLRGTASNMPIRIDRLADGTFEVDFIYWEEPHVGNADTNPDPTFIGGQIVDMYFYKNRLGFASNDSVVLSESGGYYNFYIKTCLEVLDTDPIDVAIASTKASRIYHVVPYQRGLYIFTKDAQYELVYEGSLSPTSISIEGVTAYEMNVNVKPTVTGNSLYFISTTSETTSQLREYIKDEDNLTAKGVNITLNTPTTLPTINKIVSNTALGFTIMYAESTKNKLYLYRTEYSGSERIQSAIFTWTLGFDVDNIYMFDEELYMVSTAGIFKIALLPTTDTKIDVIDNIGTEEYFVSYFTLPRWFPKHAFLKTPLDNVQIKRASIFGIGEFNVAIKRLSYDTTIERAYIGGSLANMKASIAGNTRDVEVTIKSNEDKYFRVTSLTLEGFYRQSSKELK